MPKAASVVFGLMLLLIPGCYCSAQNSHIALPPVVPQSQNLTVGSRPSQAPVSTDDEVQRQQAIAAAIQRQIEIRRDTEKMLQLMSELKEELQKTNPGAVSLDAIKKAEQIEKLAHSLKSKMRQSF